MSRKIILYIAVSLDGYIANPDGGIDWLNPDYDEISEDKSYQELYERIDTLIMGRKTYDQIVNELAIDQYPYEDLMSYIITSRPEINQEKIIYTDEPVCDLVRELLNENGKDIWIVGGSQTIAPLIEENLIDEYQITILPILLGEGIPLFRHFQAPIHLFLVSAYARQQMVYLTYEKVR